MYVYLSVNKKLPYSFVVVFYLDSCLVVCCYIFFIVFYSQAPAPEALLGAQIY